MIEIASEDDIIKTAEGFRLLNSEIGNDLKPEEVEKVDIKRLEFSSP